MGRRRGISPAERAFRNEFARVLKEIISDERGGAARAARELGISRQRISLYKREKATASGEIVRRVCKRWGVTLNVKGMLLSESSYRSARIGPAPAPSFQLPLLTDAIDALKDENLKLKIVEKVEDSIHLEIKIQFRR